MTSRSYLSIGDVLTLLREEFPDVTISKIRFLESQGLVNPERSPSGYRKFFEADVERLRWVLRQQREHFLPLKVIRDRLADGDLGEGAATSAVAASTPSNGKVAARTHAVAGAGLSGRGRMGGLGTTTTAARTVEQSTQADEEAMARILADATRRVARAPESARDNVVLRAVPDPGAPSPAGATDVLGVPRERDASRVTDTEGLRADPDAPHTSASGAPPTTAPSADVRASARSGAVAGAGAGGHAQPHADRDADEHSSHGASMSAPSAPVASTPIAVAAGSTGVAARAAGSEAEVAPVRGARGASGRGAGDLPAPSAEAGEASARGEAGARGEVGRPAGAEKRAAGAGGTAGAAGRPTGPPSERGAAAGAGAASTSGMVTGASLTSEELCAASGLSEIELAGLQGFGLIEPVMVAGIPTFDEDALTVANLAAEFRKYGIEARHLRPYRNAVDREMGLIEQVIIPLLRQRNPESRQRAVDAADELGALGQTMRATLLRTALQRHVGG